MIVIKVNCYKKLATRDFFRREGGGNVNNNNLEGYRTDIFLFFFFSFAGEMESAIKNAPQQ